MSLEDSPFTRLAGEYGLGGQFNVPGERSPPSPEEGSRLLRIFLKITEPSLRQAVVRLVEDLSVDQNQAAAS